MAKRIFIRERNILREQLPAVRIQKNADRQTLPNWTAIPGVDAIVVRTRDVHFDNDEIFCEFGGNQRFTVRMIR